MDDMLQRVVSKIEQLNALHGKKLKKNILTFNENEDNRARWIMSNYATYLQRIGKTVDYGIDCYLKMVGDMLIEQVRFAEADTYSAQSFDEVNQKAYKNPKVMEDYMKALLPQFLWVHRYKKLSFFIKSPLCFLCIGCILNKIIIMPQLFLCSTSRSRYFFKYQPGGILL
jgi:hypothetical protein